MSDLILGPIIITKYIHRTEKRGPRIVAIHRRDNDETWRRFISYDDALSAEENHLAAAEELLGSWPYENSLRIVGRGYDANAYFFLCQPAPDTVV